VDVSGCVGVYVGVCMGVGVGGCGWVPGCECRCECG